MRQQDKGENAQCLRLEFVFHIIPGDELQKSVDFIHERQPTHRKTDQTEFATLQY